MQEKLLTTYHPKVRSGRIIRQTPAIRHTPRHSTFMNFDRRFIKRKRMLNASLFSFTEHPIIDPITHITQGYTFVLFLTHQKSMTHNHFHKFHRNNFNLHRYNEQLLRLKNKLILIVVSLLNVTNKI